MRSALDIALFLRESEIPKCLLCGSEMTLAGTGPDGVTYACHSDDAKNSIFTSPSTPPSILDHYTLSRRTFRDDAAMRLYYLEQAFMKLAKEQTQNSLYREPSNQRGLPKNKVVAALQFWAGKYYVFECKHATEHTTHSDKWALLPHGLVNRSDLTS